jgi:hypothetical protein
VHELAGLEVVGLAAVEAGVLPEHDPGQERSPLAHRSPGKGFRHVRVQPVGDATDPTPPADDADILASHHDVHAAAREPATLVEAGLGPTRRD